MKKILLRLMDYGLKGVDTYTYNGSVWLIFTDTKQWVLELTSEKTLWYNYTFFKQLFCVATSDVTAKDKFITEWVEKNMIKPFYSTPGGHTDIETINDVIDNGVRETNYDTVQYSEDVEEVIQHGVKEIYEVDWVVPLDVIDEVIYDGVIETKSWNESIIGDLNQHGCIDNVIKEGIKETKTPGNGDLVSYVEWMKDKSNSYDKMIDDVIENGEKINGTYAGGQRQSEKCKSVVEYGTKNPID